MQFEPLRRGRSIGQDKERSTCFTDGIEAAMASRKAVGARDIRIGGGPATGRHELPDAVADELLPATSSAILVTGERPFDAIDLRTLSDRCTERVHAPARPRLADEGRVDASAPAHGMPLPPAAP